MSDYASIIGGNAPDSLIGQTGGLEDVGQDWDAIYHIETADVFLDRFDTTGVSIVDAAGAAGAVRVEVGSGADTVNTGAGSDSIWAGAGADSVDAGQGDNTVAGAAGDDAIRTWGGRDSIAGGEGADTVFAGSGDDYAVGGAGDDSVSGEAGDDSLFGSSGDDTLLGGLGNDSLVGGSGADSMAGGAGNDTYVAEGQDAILEAAGGGRDTVNSLSVSYVLGANLENLALTGAAARDGTGNGLANVLTGNNLANLLRGGGGADTLRGNGGDDALALGDRAGEGLLAPDVLAGLGGGEDLLDGVEGEQLHQLRPGGRGEAD